MPYIKSPQLRAHVRLTLQALGKISSDETLRADCDRESRLLRVGTVPGILTEPAVSQER
jgi:hypothetical protein